MFSIDTTIKFNNKMIQVQRLIQLKQRTYSHLITGKKIGGCIMNMCAYIYHLPVISLLLLFILSFKQEEYKLRVRFTYSFILYINHQDQHSISASCGLPDQYGLPGNTFATHKCGNICPPGTLSVATFTIFSAASSFRLATAAGLGLPWMGQNGLAIFYGIKKERMDFAKLTNIMFVH